MLLPTPEACCSSSTEIYSSPWMVAPFQRVGGGTAQTFQGTEGQAYLAVLHHILGAAALAQLDGQELVAAHQHLVDQLQADQHILVLGVLLFLQAALDLFHVGAGHAAPPTAAS